MKSNFPTQLYLITLLLGLSVAGWFFVDSCKLKCAELVTTVGDASILEDKKIAITLSSTTTKNVRLESNLLVTFKDDSVAEEVVPGIVTKVPITLRDFRVGSEQEGTRFFLWTNKNQLDNNKHPFPIASLIVEEMPAKSMWIPFDVRTIKIGDIYYFTLENISLNRYGPDDPDRDDGVTIDYTVQSGIWAYYETKTPSDDLYSSTEGHLENVVPYTVTGPSGASEVYGFYATEDETALVLITVENGTDLYATFYDIQAKTASTPRLVYHCENGRILPHILNVNSTCPLGSILVLNESNEENVPDELHAFSFREEKASGELEIIDYPMDNYNWRWLDGVKDYDSYRIVGAGDKGNTYGSSDIYYIGDELWVVSYAHGVIDFRFGDIYRGNPSLQRYEYSDSDDEIFHGQLIQEYLIQGYRDNALFYEGVLSVDLTVANPELRFMGHDNAYEYPYWNNVFAQVTLLSE